MQGSGMDTDWKTIRITAEGVSGKMCSVEHHPSPSSSPYSSTQILNQPSPRALFCKGQGDIDAEGKKGESACSAAS